MERLGRKAMTRLFGVGVIAAALVLAPTAARAALITGLDYGAVSATLGSLYQNDIMTTTFISADGTTKIGQLTSSVYSDGTSYTYVLAVTPSVAGMTRLSSGFLPPTATTVAGWSFADAVLAGAPAPGTAAFTIIQNTTNISWTAGAAATSAGLWNASNEDLVTFFFQSAIAPGLSTYNLGGALVTGAAAGFAPVAVAAVPEPSTLLLLGFGVFGLAVAARGLKGVRPAQAV